MIILQRDCCNILRIIWSRTVRLRKTQCTAGNAHKMAYSYPKIDLLNVPRGSIAAESFLLVEMKSIAAVYDTPRLFVYC